MTTKLIRTIAAAAAVFAAGVVLAACSSDNATGPSKAQVKDALSANAGGKVPTTTATTTPTPTTTATPTATATTTTQATTTTTASADGKAVFTQNCAACHTLSAAGASGQVGPNLDTLKPSAGAVESQVNAGGGAMPAFKGQLSPAEIKAVATYVADNAGK